MKFRNPHGYKLISYQLSRCSRIRFVALWKKPDGTYATEVAHAQVTGMSIQDMILTLQTKSVWVPSNCFNQQLRGTIISSA